MLNVSDLYIIIIIVVVVVDVVSGTFELDILLHYASIFRSGGVAPCILSLGAIWSCVVSFIPGV
jgi:hypothetical protein